MQKNNLYKSLLEEREIIQIEGEEKLDFLQNLITNNIFILSEKRAIYSALLSPQGKYLFDFILFLHGGKKQKIFLDCEKKRSSELITLLNMYNLRKNISISKVIKAKVYVIFGDFNNSFLSKIELKNSVGFSRSTKKEVMLIDPRNKILGIRVIHFTGNLSNQIESINTVDFEKWNYLRINLGVPEGSIDMEVNKSFLMENNFEFINAIDFSKGCYLGQENTARQKYRATLKKRLMKVKIFGDAIPNGSKIFYNGKIVGLMRSSSKNIGLATIKIDEAKNAALKKTKLSTAESYIEINEDLK